jgi:hypothetical protein
MKTTTRNQQDSIVLEVRRLKEENAAEYGFNARAIGAAARLHQQDHPERIVSREQPVAEQGVDGKPPEARQPPR